MSKEAFKSELDRARSRLDAKTLLLDVEDYRLFDRDVRGLEDFVGVEGGNFCHVQDAHWDEPDKGLAYLALALATYDDEYFLGLLAAGLLEDLLRDPSPQLLERIIVEARRTPRFRWMLAGVWLHAIAERARASVKQLVGNGQLEDPLPPAPS